MRCAWCGATREVTYHRLADHCALHRGAFLALHDAVYRLSPGFAYEQARGPIAQRTKRAETQRAQADARELRGERIDWTRPVEGWVLW